MKIYISGRITGLPYDQVERVFDTAQAYLEAQGFEVLNPTKNGLDPSASWEEHMAADLTMLFSADGIYMLPGWQESKGAKVEYYVAHALEMPVYFSGL